MSVFDKKVDFALIIAVENANPNGDPLDGNRPRTTFDGRGEISDVCLKRKIRNRLQDEGKAILVQSDERRNDACRSINDRVNAAKELKNATSEDFSKIACQTWFDVRAFGQVFAFGKSEETDSKSVGVRGPVSIQSAFSLEPVEVASLQITKSVNLSTGKDPDKKASDTMGMKHRVEKGIYVTKGSINVQLAEKTGFTKEDSQDIKDALRTLFINDVSSARPDGSMEVVKLIWWQHDCKNGQYSSARVHRSLKVAADGSYILEQLPGLKCEEIDGV